MKNKNLLLGALIFGLLLIGCNKSSEDEFNNANGDVAVKYIRSVDIINSDDPSENRTYTLHYDGENRVSSYTDGNSSGFLNYSQNGELNSMTDEYETLEISELYQAPYDAFENGEVIEYDSKGNPIVIEVWEDGFGSNLLNGEIIYDPNPNPFFYTLKAAGVIDVIDQVDLNFGYNHPAIIKARQLLPYNSIRAMIFKNMSGITEYEVQINYEYDNDGYPIKADIVAISPDESSTYTVFYTYK